jgi:hypothetical protein
MLILVAGALRRCVIACFQQWLLPERPPMEEIRATFLPAENSRRFQSDDAAKAVSARIRSMHPRRSLSVKAFIYVRTQFYTFAAERLVLIKFQNQESDRKGRQFWHVSGKEMGCGRDPTEYPLSAFIFISFLARFFS